jgi:ergothioneine biosynthesis protein EgtB
MAELMTEAPPDALAERYRRVRALTEQLAAPLSPEDQTVQSMPDTSPAKWHRAHTSWFFETFVLEQFLPDYREFHPGFRYLFNSYYEGVGARLPRPRRGLVSRPGAAEIGEYRRHVDTAMDRLLGGGIDRPTFDLFELGLHHEQQHQELLLMDIKHVLSCNPLSPAYASSALTPPAASPKMRWISHEGGLVEIGHDGDGFAFDNESPRHAVYLAPFALSSRQVTCGDWTQFIDDGGYHRAELWLSDGWATVQAERWEAPLYWSTVDGCPCVFTLHGARPVDPAEPVCHVSYYEADAFARWARARLPTEHEWEAVATVSDSETEPDLYALHPAPTTTDARFSGAVWQWTSSAYSPYPGFQPAPGAVGEYNGKFMVNQYVLRGGACITPPGHTRATYRNFFSPASRWPFTGLRLARDR